MINIYVTIHTSIHQSITTALPQRGGARMMWKKRERERERGLQGGREGVEREKWAAVILKGCEQVTTPSAPQLQRRNSGTLAAVCRGWN